MVDRFKTARLDVLARFFDGFFDWLLDSFDYLRDLTRYFNFFRDLLVGPVDAGDVGKEIEGEFGIVAQKRGDGDSARGRRGAASAARWGWGSARTPRPRREPPPRLPP